MSKQQHTKTLAELTEEEFLDTLEEAYSSGGRNPMSDLIFAGGSAELEQFRINLAENNLHNRQIRSL